MLDSDDLQSHPLLPNARLLCTLYFMEELLAWRNEHALFLSVVSPSTCSCFTAMLLRISLDSLLELRSEMSH